MAKAEDIAKFLNKELNVKKIKDSSKNGLQIKASKDIKKVGFAVDACLTTFEKAKKENVNLLIVHHGLLWKEHKDDAGLKKGRINFLKKNKISLYGCHLPLDMHKEYGNNIQLARLLNLKNIKKFGVYQKETIGYKGSFKKNTTVKKIAAELNRKIKTRCVILNFGNKNIRTIGIISGGGGSDLYQAYQKRLDCFLTGEAQHHNYNEAKDLKINMIIAGHYATETVGVKALMNLIKEKFKVKIIFIDNPTNK